MENVQELVNFASETETSEGIAGGVPPDADERSDGDEEWDVLPEMDRDGEEGANDAEAAPQEGRRPRTEP